MSSSQSSVEANPNHAAIVRLLGNTLRLFGLALQLKPLPWDAEMLAFLERTAESLNRLAEMNVKVVKGDDSNQHILPPLLKLVPDEADQETRQEILEMNLFYIDRSLSQTLPLLGDDPINDAFFVQVTLFSRSRPSYTVAQLEARGLVKRQADADDKRGISAALTSDGMAHHRKLARTHLEGIRRHFWTQPHPPPDPI